MNVLQAFGMLQQIKTNPMSLLSQKFNIPDGVNVNDPNAIINHLLSSGQIQQSQIDAIKNGLGGFLH
jgi:hypothetical protein